MFRRLQGLALPTTSAVAAILGVEAVILGFRVIMKRQDARVLVGDGGNDVLALRRCAFSNLAEWAPTAVGLLALVEGQRLAPCRTVFWTGAALVTGRVLHGIAFSGEQPLDRHMLLRKSGMILTIGAVLTSAGIVLTKLVVSCK